MSPLFQDFEPLFGSLVPDPHQSPQTDAYPQHCNSNIHLFLHSGLVPGLEAGSSTVARV